MIHSSLLKISNLLVFASYANDITINKARSNIDNVIVYYSSHSQKLFKQISDNQVKGNNDKCYLIISSKDSSEIKIGNTFKKRPTYKKTLGVKIDTKLTFNDHIKDMYRKINSNLGALGKVISYMGLAKNKLLKNLQ